jgi:hypothetical protein
MSFVGCLSHWVEATYAIRHYKSGMDVFESDILIVVGANPLGSLCVKHLFCGTCVCKITFIASPLLIGI